MSNVMIRIEDEEVLHPVVHAVEMATGRRPNKSTTYRWMSRGIRQVRMPYVMLGGQRMASVESVRRWISAVTMVASGAVPESNLPKQRESRIVNAEQQLSESGW